MKSSLNGLIVLAAAGTLAGIAAPANAVLITATNGSTTTTIFNSGGFENDTVGSVPSTARIAGTWYDHNSTVTKNGATSTGSGNVTNAASPGAYTGNSYFVAVDHAQREYAYFGEQTSGTLQATFAFNPIDPYTVLGFANTAAPAGATNTIGNSLNDLGTMMTFRPVSGTLQVQNYGPHPTSNAYFNLTHDNGSNYTVADNTWYEMTVEYTVGASTYTVTIDGVKSDPLSLINGAGIVPKGFLFESNGQSAGAPYSYAIDSVTVPEPASLGLLGLGALWAYAGVALLNQAAHVTCGGLSAAACRHQ